jgi:hypothetical protein
MANFDQRMREFLGEVAAQEELIAVHANPEDPEAFEVGFVGHLSRETFSLRAVSTKGLDDGVRVFPYDVVVRMHRDSDYLRGLRALFENRDRAFKGIDSALLEIAGKGFEEALRAAQARNLAVTLRFPTQAIQGFVRNVGEGWAEIEVIVENGMSDGLFLTDLTDTDRIFVGGHEEQALGFLYRERYGLKHPE